MAISPQLERMKYIKGLHDKIVNTILVEEQEAKEELIMQICYENQTLLQTYSPTFIYNDLWFPHSIREWDVSRLKQCNKHLHPDCRAKMQELFKVDFNDQEIQAGIKALIGKILISAKHITDLLELLPNASLYYGLDLISEIFNIGSPITSSEIIAFKETNKKLYDIMKRLSITKLLLAKV